MTQTLLQLLQNRSCEVQIGEHKLVVKVGGRQVILRRAHFNSVPALVAEMGRRDLTADEIEELLGDPSERGAQLRLIQTELSMASTERRPAVRQVRSKASAAKPHAKSAARSAPSDGFADSNTPKGVEF